MPFLLIVFFFILTIIHLPAEHHDQYADRSVQATNNMDRPYFKDSFQALQHEASSFTQLSHGTQLSTQVEGSSEHDFTVSVGNSHSNQEGQEPTSIIQTLGNR
jgi:hypothetical protein